MCSRKDYKAIAAEFKEAYAVAESDSVRTALEGMAERVAGYFALNNPRFDWPRFIEACGVTE